MWITHHIFRESLSLISRHILLEIQEKCANCITQYLVVLPERKTLYCPLSNAEQRSKSSHNSGLHIRGLLTHASMPGFIKCMAHLEWSKQNSKGSGYQVQGLLSAEESRDNKRQQSSYMFNKLVAWSYLHRKGISRTTGPDQQERGFTH